MSYGEEFGEDTAGWIKGKSLDEAHVKLRTEELKLETALAFFKTAQLEVLKDRNRRGFRGWADPTNEDAIKARLHQTFDTLCTNDFANEDLVHLANYAMFLWSLRENEK